MGVSSRWWYLPQMYQCTRRCSYCPAAADGSRGNQGSAAGRDCLTVDARIQRCRRVFVARRVLFLLSLSFFFFGDCNFVSICRRHRGALQSAVFACLRGPALWPLHEPKPRPWPSSGLAARRVG